MVPPRIAEVRRVAQHAFDLAAHALALAVDRLLERERLTAEGGLVLVVRERAVDRIAQQCDQPHVRQELRDTLRRERMEEVAWARLPDGRRAPGREVRAVPALAVCVVAVEEAHLLERRAGDLRVPAQVGVKGGSPRLLCPEDEEVRKGPHRDGRAAIGTERAAENLARGLGHARDELRRQADKTRHSRQCVSAAVRRMRSAPAGLRAATAARRLACRG